MGSIDRYIFRTTLASFALVLVSLTGVIWITQALRGIDLMTSQGQTILTFLGVTSLVIPALVLIISPIALMIAISHTLNKLATDSEIIVMNAAGFSPFRLFRPFLYATCVVALLVAFIASYLAPDGMRRLKQWDAEITADVLTNILQPGRFAQLDQNLTIRIRERQPGGLLKGILIDDRRDPKERATIIADHGTVVKSGDGSFLVLEDGNLQRFEADKRDPALVAFGRYAFDMSKFSKGHDVTLGIRERYLWELLDPADDDPVYKQIPGQFRAELHDRFMAPIYPFAFAALTFRAAASLLRKAGPPYRNGLPRASIAFSIFTNAPMPVSAPACVCSRGTSSEKIFWCTGPLSINSTWPKKRMKPDSSTPSRCALKFAYMMQTRRSWPRFSSTPFLERSHQASVWSS